MNFLSAVKNSFFKTHEKIKGGLNQIINKGVIDDALWEELEMLLVSADTGPKTAAEIIARLKRTKLGSAAELRTVLMDEVAAIMKQFESSVTLNGPAPYCIMVVGVNGVGKTTTIAKLSNYFLKLGKTVMLGAADTFRAAAVEQLEIWANRAGVDIVKQKEGADPAAVAYDSLQSAKSKGIDVLIIDTAGRLHTKTNLMDELKKIKRVLSKEMNTFPQEVLLVLDATLGQNALNQARNFTESVGVTGLVMTKLDGTAKGGILINVARELNTPIKFIGTGEKIDDLEVFSAKDFAEGILQ